MSNIAMTVADQELINKAEKLHWTEGDIADGFIDLAQSDEAKKILRGIRNYLYHKEEFACGNL
jgi:hypothetical protein